jgi:hypothetical protein
VEEERSTGERETVVQEEGRQGRQARETVVHEERRNEWLQEG